MKYDIAKAVLVVEDFFINDLSLWYLRRSRKRFHQEEDDKKKATQTLYFVLLQTAKIIAPIIPFLAEKIYQDLKINDMPESVHLCDFPKSQENTDLELEEKMDEVRSIVGLALAQRSLNGVKIRQPLASLKIKNEKLKIKGDNDFLELVKEEVNVKEVLFDAKITEDIRFDLDISQDLKQEGILRDIARIIQDARKEAMLEATDKVLVNFSGSQKILSIINNKKYLLLGDLKTTDISNEDFKKPILEREVMVDDEKIVIKLRRQ